MKKKQLFYHRCTKASVINYTLVSRSFPCSTLCFFHNQMPINFTLLIPFAFWTSASRKFFLLVTWYYPSLPQILFFLPFTCFPSIFVYLVLNITANFYTFLLYIWLCPFLSLPHFSFLFLRSLFSFTSLPHLTNLSSLSVFFFFLTSLMEFASNHKFMVAVVGRFNHVHLE